jgi:5-hydroxyisourate hydrolase-like protein (transthyretin family)
MLVVKDPSGHSSNVYAATLSNGSYSFNRTETLQGTYFYEVWFLGNSQYFQCEAMIGALPVGNPIQTTLSVSVSNPNPAVGQTFTFSGYLKANGTALSGEEISAQECYPTGNTSAWRPIGSATTDANGYFSITRSEQTSGEYWYEFWFVGNGTYATCSNGMYVPIGTLESTSLSMNSSVTNPAVGQSFTLSGYLVDASGTPLAGKAIDIGRSADGQTSVVAIRYTDQNGYYFLNWNETTQGSYRYTAAFNGDQTYSLSTAAVSITVGTPTPTTLTLTSSNPNPVVNQSFTLSGKLTSNGTALAGKKITLLCKNPAGQWSNLGSTTTGSSGQYSFTVSEPSTGHYSYQSDFPGDAFYATSYAGAGVNVVL